MMASFAVIAGACVAAWALDDASEGNPRAFARFIVGATAFVAGVVGLVI